VFAVKNIIKKMTVEVETHSMEQALQIKDRIDAIIKRKIVPILESHFEKYDSRNHAMVINTLDLNLELETTYSNAELTSTLLEQLKEQLGQNVAFQKGQNHQKIPLKNKPIQTLLYFLETGKLPWWGTIPEAHFESVEQLQQLITKAELQKILSNSNSLNRIIKQFDNQIINTIFLKLFFETPQKKQKRFSIPKILQKPSFKYAFWQWAFHSFAKGVHPSDLNLFIGIFADEISSTKKKSIEAKYDRFQLKEREIKDLKELFQFCNEALQIPLAIHATKRPKTFELLLMGSAGDAFQKNKKHWSKIDTSWECDLKLQKVKEKHESVIHHSTIKAENKMEPELITTIDESDGILVPAAGLILLHPFLRRFFANIGINDATGLDPSKKELAAHLLHYLAFGKEHPFEYELQFEKYLCNIPVGQPVERFIKLKKNQKEACNTLLEAVLVHWNGLKTNNIDVLRNEFLQREGKLVVSKDRHQLYIQRITQDILLDGLPWNLNLVKLPWKESMLFVNW